MAELRGSPLEGGFGASLAALSSLAEVPPPAANPHGIDHILSRPTSAGAAGGLLAPRLSLAAAAGMAHYLQHKPLYWPGFQGLVSNPIAWRERLQSNITLTRQFRLRAALGPMAPRRRPGPGPWVPRAVGGRAAPAAGSAR
ncbi:hypothetical protein EVAR_43215_1 [Eumeta japonica]|uniref:Uncharacterized protein n=1 Tax=Eumeta variegata TaxID=151549 RepID=A0A4C1WTK3_EUMVA|nr:hypothetical protein EVAR_43215_1 [Eumeta japonica]